MNDDVTRDAPRPATGPAQHVHPAQPSPCIGICRIDPDSGYCVGCFRSLDEICSWLSLEIDERAEVVGLCEERRSQLREPDSQA